MLPQLDVPAPAGAAETAPAGVRPERVFDDFDAPAIDLRFSTLRRPLTPDWATLRTRSGALSVRGGHALTSRFDTSLVATQLQDFVAVATTRVEVEPRHFSHSAGLVVFYDNDNHAYLRVYRSESLDSVAIGIVLVRAGSKQELLLDRVAIDTGVATLRASLDHAELQFSASWSDGDFRPVGPVIDVSFLGDEATRGFTGTMIGIACVDAFRRDLVAHFDFFDLRHGVGRAG